MICKALKSRRRMRRLVRMAVNQHVKKKGTVVRRDDSVLAVDIDCSESRMRCSTSVCHCVTASRGRSGGPWLWNRGRRTTIPELFQLQGVHYERLKDEIEKVDNSGRRVFSDTFIGHAIGNSTSANVVERILPVALESVGLLAPGDWTDRYSSGCHSVLPAWRRG